MTRIDAIHQRLANLERRGIIRDVWTHTPDGRKWVFTPCGFGERSLSTSQVEDFLLGADAVLNATRADQERIDRDKAREQVLYRQDARP